MRGALALALLLPLSGVADAPPPVLIIPLAECSAGKCVMSEKDFETLRDFHRGRMAALQAAGAQMDALIAENAELMRMLGRLSAGACSLKANRV